jgi:hypothetical protein
MNFPLTLWDLGLWLGLNGVILFLTSFGIPFVKRTFMIERSGLQKAGLLIIGVFTLVVILQSYDLWMIMLSGAQKWFMQLF